MLDDSLVPSVPVGQLEGTLSMPDPGSRILPSRVICAKRERELLILRGQQLRGDSAPINDKFRWFLRLNVTYGEPGDNPWGQAVSGSFPRVV